MDDKPDELVSGIREAVRPLVGAHRSGALTLPTEPRREDRRSLVEHVFTLHRERTNAGAWQGKDQLLLDHLLAWESDL